MQVLALNSNLHAKKSRYLGKVILVGQHYDTYASLMYTMRDHFVFKPPVSLIQLFIRSFLLKSPQPMQRKGA